MKYRVPTFDRKYTAVDPSSGIDLDTITPPESPLGERNSESFKFIGRCDFTYVCHRKPSQQAVQKVLLIHNHKATVHQLASIREQSHCLIFKMQNQCIWR